jgi:hypothetical protein
MAKGQKGMGHEKAARAASLTVKTVESGHKHTCTLCLTVYKHDDPKCKNVGLAYNGLCTVCSPVVDTAIKDMETKLQQGLSDALNASVMAGESATVVKYDDIIPESGGPGAESQG